MIIKETNITINVKDMAKSVSFYESIGFTVKNRWGNDYAQLNAHGLTIGLHPSKNIKPDSGNISIGLITDDFEKSKEHLNSLTIKTTFRSEEGGEFIHFTDPDGNLLYIIKPKW